MEKPIRLFSGLTIGWVIEDSSGNKVVKDKALRIVSRYNKSNNTTTSATGKILTFGDTASGVLLLQYGQQLR